MALLVTIGNVCILGNFQLGIWGKLGVTVVYYISCGSLYREPRGIKTH